MVLLACKILHSAAAFPWEGRYFFWKEDLKFLHLISNLKYHINKSFENKTFSKDNLLLFRNIRNGIYIF